MVLDWTRWGWTEERRISDALHVIQTWAMDLLRIKDLAGFNNKCV
jgi:hypothetical protein